MSDPCLKITESVIKSNLDTNIKKSICDQLGKWYSKYLLNIYIIKEKVQMLSSNVQKWHCVIQSMIQCFLITT